MESSGLCGRWKGVLEQTPWHERKELPFTESVDNDVERGKKNQPKPQNLIKNLTKVLPSSVGFAGLSPGMDLTSWVSLPAPPMLCSTAAV